MSVAGEPTTPKPEKLRELQARHAAMLKLADERVSETARLEHRVLELEAHVRRLEGR